MCSYFAAFTLAPLYAINLGMNPALVGLVVSLTFVAPMILAIPLGSFIDRSGAKSLLLSGTAIAAAMPLAVVAWPGPVALGITQIGLGMAHIQLMLAGQTLTATIGGGSNRLRNFGWYTMAVSAGQLVGPLVAGFGADMLSIRGTFLLVVALALLAFTCALTIQDNRIGKRNTLSRTTSDVRRELAQLWTNPMIRLAMLASSSVLLAVAINQALLPVMLTRAAYPATTVGILFSAQGLAAMAVRPFLSVLGEWAPSKAILLLAVVGFVAGGITLIGLQLGFLWLIVSMILLGAGSGVSQPLSMIMVLDPVTANQRGLALGFRISANRVAQVLGPIVLGMVATQVGVQAAYAVTVAVAGGLVFPAWVRQRNRAPRRHP